MKALADRLFPGRFRLALALVVLVVSASCMVRLALLVVNGDASLARPPALLAVLLVGGVYDLAVALCFAVPAVLAAWLAPQGRAGRLVFIGAGALVCAIVAATIAFTEAAEFVFWHEFGVRFNFIAVDYLVYTQEVLGNIRESYALAPMLAGVGLVAVVMLALLARPLARAASSAPMGLGARTRVAALLLIGTAAGVALLDERPKDWTAGAQAAQLAANGVWEFFHAFRGNEIDYEVFYATMPLAGAHALLREEFAHAGPVRFVDGARLPIERDIVPPRPMRKLNVVMVSVESLSADFLGAFGNPKGLTPNLDRLAAEGLLFTRLYATGTRTVRGLEALSLSLPPTPGHSVVKRPDNEHLLTLGEVFGAHGYESLYLYGGYAYFDNMRAFFGANGYTVIDRGALADADVHYANIWGVADEDLFTLTLRELDARHAAGTPFFAHVMTTSNHRPYTYPEGRIDIPSGSGRDGAVKYTDWALGDFIARARAKPWFDDTIFVIVADHCASSRGRTELPIDRFHIPMIVYAPRHIAAGRVETVASQIDVPPTLLALLDAPYRSRFFGQDILTDGRVHQRALLANYQTVGYLEDGVLVSLRPRRAVRVEDSATGTPLAPDDPRAVHYREEAIAYYLAASDAFRSGALRAPVRTRVAGVPAVDDGRGVVQRASMQPRTAASLQPVMYGPRPATPIESR